MTEFPPGLILEVAQRAGLQPRRRGSEWVVPCPNAGAHRNADAHASCRLNAEKNTFFCDPCGQGGGLLDFARLVGTPIEDVAGEQAARPRTAPVRRSVARRPQRHFESTGSISIATQAQIARRLGRSFTAEAWEKAGVQEGQVGGEPAIGFPQPGGGWKMCLYLHPNTKKEKSYSWRFADGGKADLLLIGTGEEVLLVAGEWDLLAALSAGVTCVATSTGGEGHWKPEWTQRLAGKTVLVVYDVDPAGRRGSWMVATILAAAGVTVFDVKLPLSGDPDRDGKDLCDFLALNDPIALHDLLATVVAAGPFVPEPTPGGMSQSESISATPPDETPLPLADPHQQLEEILAFVTNDADTPFKLKVFQRLLPVLHQLEPAPQELACKAVKQKLGIGIGAIRKSLEMLPPLKPRSGTTAEPSETPGPECQALLRDPRLIDRFLEDTTRLGVVGEEPNRSILLLVMTSRRCERPLNLAVKAESSSGKNHLVESVAQLMPPADVVRISVLSPQSLNYWDGDLTGKVLIVTEAEGSDRADYSLRVLQSEGFLSVHYVTKVDGQLKTVERTVKGPTATITTTTRDSLHPENETRLIEMSLDESSEQTARILKVQARRYLEKPSPETVAAIRRLWAGTQTLLESLPVQIPFAECIRFSSNQVRARRDFPKLLNLIEASAFLHQFQRERVELNGHTHIIATLEDYALAHRLLLTFLDRIRAGLSDREEHVRALLKDFATKEFTVREVAEALTWHAEAGRRRAKRALDNLVDKGWAESEGEGKGKATRYRYAEHVTALMNAGAGVSSPEEVATAWSEQGGHLDTTGTTPVSNPKQK